MLQNIYVIIPARGGSRGIPEKNLTYFNGETLLSRAIKLALKVTCPEKVIVSTNDDEIEKLAALFNVGIVKRPIHLCGDNVTLDPVINNACEMTGINDPEALIITLQVTSPNLTLGTLNAAINQMNLSGCDTLISATSLKHLTWRKHDGKFLPNYEARVNRQYMAEIYQETGAFLITKNKWVSNQTRIGKIKDIYVVPDDEADDVDDILDYHAAIKRTANNKIAFKLVGNNKVGTGHIFNCINLARKLPEFEKHFFVTHEDDIAVDILKGRMYNVTVCNIHEIDDKILAFRPKVAILDKLDTTIEEIQKLKNSEIQVISFEDLGAGSHYTDLTVNPLYPETLSKGTILSGPRYFSPNPNFFMPRHHVDETDDLLVFFGGTDPCNHTESLIWLLKDNEISEKFSTTVLLGIGAQLSDQCFNYIENCEHINLVKYTNDICALISRHRLAITSAGRTMYELAYLKKPFLVCFQNERERRHFNAINENAIIQSFDFPNVSTVNSIQCLLQNGDDRVKIIDSLANIRLGEKSNLIEQNIRKMMVANV